MKEGEKNVTATDLMIEAFFKLLISSFYELMKYSDKVEALAALKPYRKWAAQVAVETAKKNMNIQSNGPDAMLITYAFAGLFAVPPNKMECEIREKGAVGVFRDCILAGVGSPDLCVSISHFASEAVAEAINPEYECVWTHHESSGDAYCRLVFKRKADPVSVVDDLGSTMMVLPKFEVSEEQLKAARLWAITGFAWGNISAFRDLHGEEETKEVMGAVSQRIGQEMGARLSKENPELGESVVSVGKLVRGMQNAWGQRDSFVTVSENEVSNEITDCAAMSVHAPICVYLESLLNGIVSGINPDYEFAYDRMISKGDKTCRWTLKRR